ncbi:MAG: 50S ribosomal protein L9 [Acidobacteria bacterium]|nr:50S ribosomal protein L9 [Acidobacteriota bacterium]
MKIILTQDVDNLGHRGDVLQVADGYGRNYLIPKRLAALATEANIRGFEQRRKSEVKHEAKEKDDAEVLGRQLQPVTLTIARKTGEQDALYGSVTAMDIAEALSGKGFEIDKRKIQLEDPIRTLGSYRVPIRLHREVTVEVPLDVVKEE